jgi:hypothetical protein
MKVACREMSLAEIQQAVQHLPLQQKGELVAWILEDLPTTAQGDDLDEMREAQRRKNELDTGKVKALSENEFWSALQADPRCE